MVLQRTHPYKLPLCKTNHYGNMYHIYFQEVLAFLLVINFLVNICLLV